MTENRQEQKIPPQALHAGELVLREHADIFEDGTELGSYDYVVKEIVRAVLGESQ